MVKTYILAPNWTTAPPPDGPVNLGHILDDLTELVPVNRTKIINIPTEWLNPHDTKTGFSMSRSKLISGEFGFVAKIMGLVGVGAGAGVYYKKDKNDVLSCQKLITLTFDPTNEYIEQSMALPELQQFMRACNFRAPVFMITGMKIAHGGVLQNSTSKKTGVRMDGGIMLLQSPVVLDGRAGVQKAVAEGESWGGSSPFIVAFRVRKIWYKHRDEHGQIKNKTHKERVVMQDGAAVQVESELLLTTDDEVVPSDVSKVMDFTVEKDGENSEEMKWIIPNMDVETFIETD